jgi:phosphohistidine phosphatase
MKTLYLVRHAKSSWDDMSAEDYERVLLPKGINRTTQVAKYLLSKKVVPDLIVSSQAVRAIETARILARKLNYPNHEIQIEPLLYFSGSQAMYHVVFGLPNAKNEVMLVGHNPDMTQFANVFLHEKIDYLPTTGVVSISFKTDRWEEIMMAEREVNFVITPKSI